MKGGTSSSNRGQQTTGKTDKQSPQGKFQPTAEQVRYAQLLNEEEPIWLKEKIQKVADMTNKPPDEVAIALHDCDNCVETAVFSLLEGKYDQGEWTTFSNRKKKSVPADTISPVTTKDKPPTGNARQDRKEKDSGGVVSQSVEYNNRRNKGQLDRISDGNNVARQNGPLHNRPPGGGRNRNRDDRDERRGDHDERREDRRGDNEDRRGERDTRRGDRGDQSDQGDRRNRNDYRDRDRNDRGNRGGRGDRDVRWDQNDRGSRGDRGDNRGDRGDNRGDRGVNRGDRNDRGDRSDYRGDRSDYRGDRGDNRSDRGDSRGDRGDNRGDRGDNRGDRGDNRGDRGDNRGDRGDNRGDRGDYRGDRGDNRGDRGDNRGDRGDNRGDRGDNRGDRWNNEDRSGDRGDRRFGGRGGFNRRGGMNRGGRGGRGGRGRFPNNRGGRRSEQLNGPSKDTEFSSTPENWDATPEKNETDWSIPEPKDTTEEWGAEDWASETLNTNDTSNTPSWAQTGEKSETTWENDAPANQNLTNHVNHLPECDDDAILSSKVASKPSSLIQNHEEPVRFTAASTVSSQPYPLDTSTFSLASDVPSTAPKDTGIAALASAGLSKITNHHSSSMDASRVRTSTGQGTTTVQQPAVIMPVDSEPPQPQRQQKSRTKRVPKGQIPKQAVEMPGNNGGMDSLDVQFGNLEFGRDLITGPKAEEVRVVQQKEESIPVSTTENISTSQPAATPAVVTTVSPPAPKPVTMETTSMSSEGSVVNTYEEMSPRHYAPPGTPVSKSAMTQITPESSPRQDKVELREPKTPPMTKKVDVSTSPMPLTATMTTSVAKNNNEGVASRATSLHSQIGAIATSDDRLDERVHQQAPAIGHSPSPHADQNAMRSRLSGVGVSSSTTTRPNPTPAGVTLSGSSPAGPPPGIISGIQPTSAGPPKTSSSSINRQTAHGTKPPNLPPGVVTLPYMPPAPGFAGFSPLGYPLDDIQMIQRMPMPPYYDIPFPVAGREGVQNSYSGADVKYNRNDTSSPVPSTLTAGPHGQQAPFINTHAQLHPFGYAGNLAFYHGGGMIGGFAAPYTAQMYQLPTKGPGVTTQFQQNFANQLGPHYTSGYDGLSNAHDFSKQGYQHPTQSKASAVSGSTASNSASDLSTAYKPQFTDKGYLSGTPPPPLNISLPGQAHQHHPAGFPLVPVLAPTQHPPSLFPTHHLSHQQQLDNLNPNRGAQNQGKVSQSKSHHGQSIYPPQFWSGTN